MKKAFFSLLTLTAAFFATNSVQAQQIKVGVFDIDYMVQAMPGYAGVDSLLQIYEVDSLNPLHDVYVSEYQRLDSTWKSDSASGKPKAVLDYTNTQRQQMMYNLVYWQQIAQSKETNKRNELAQPLYQQVADAYKKVLDAKKYTLILKPDAVEYGTSIADNLFIAVAKELKLTSLPQELLQPQLGNDPDAQKTAPGTTGGGTKKP